MNFKLIAGHEHNISHIKEMIQSGRIPHGILLTGPEGIGKRLAAVAMAAALNCADPGEDGACGKCVSCRKLKSGNHPMVRFAGSTKNEEELAAEFSGGEKVIIKNIGGEEAPAETAAEEDLSSNKKKVKISIEQIRQIKREVFLKPYKDSKKVFIVDDAANASPGALNCLLKILEEPPENTYFILVTSSGDSLPATIISRCSRYRFRPLTEKEMKYFLGLRPDAAKGVKDLSHQIKISGGSPGKFIEYSHIKDIKPGTLKTEKYFKVIKKWMGDKSESLRKLNIMLQLEGYDFRESPSGEKLDRVKIIEDTIERLNKNANRELAISNMFLKLDGLS
ncbi:MAG: hypothetical protein U9R36_06125 [Elusimicrobiota bacterium]|nr:hypothetical protein [Elusimicrobiota bacterium]